jgi:Rod binding domain-containing protein
MFSSDATAIAAPLAAANAGTPSAAPAATQASNATDEAKLKKAAGDFEAILLASMWKGMKQSFGTSEADSDPAHGTLDDWGIEVMSGAVGRAGGLGIGKLILEHLQPALHGQTAATTVDGQTTSGNKK